MAAQFPVLVHACMADTGDYDYLFKRMSPSLRV